LDANGAVGPFLTVNGPSFAQIAAPLTLAATTTVRGGSGGILKLSGTIGGGGGLAVSLAGGRWLALSGNNTFTGGTTLNDGNLVLAHNNALGAAGNTLTVNGGALVLGTTTSDPSRTVSNNIVANATLVVMTTAPGASTLGGVISGNGGLTFDAVPVGTSPGPFTTLTLSGANTFTGATTLRRGNIVLTGATGALTATSGVTALGTALVLDN
jgi:autotransporter-associated beta strand protein